MLAGLGWLAVLLRIDAVVSPTGTGLIYLTSGSRILFALSKNGYIPRDVRERLRPRPGAGRRDPPDRGASA